MLHFKFVQDYMYIHFLFEFKQKKVKKKHSKYILNKKTLIFFLGGGGGLLLTSVGKKVSFVKIFYLFPNAQMINPIKKNVAFLPNINKLDKERQCKCKLQVCFFLHQEVNVNI